MEDGNWQISIISLLSYHGLMIEHAACLALAAPAVAEAVDSGTKGLATSEIDGGNRW